VPLLRQILPSWKTMGHSCTQTKPHSFYCCNPSFSQGEELPSVLLDHKGGLSHRELDEVAGLDLDSLTAIVILDRELPCV